MRKNLLYSIGILILFISCKQKQTEKPKISGIKPSVELSLETVRKIEEVFIPEQFIENDSLISLLESDLNKLALNPKFKLKTEPKTNQYDETITDTIKTLVFDKSKIYTYQSTNWESIYRAEIENPEFEFLDSIKIGMQKETLNKKIKAEIETDLIRIGNLEQTSVFTFQFENEKLKRIIYDGYVD
jgi:hypothetical protein